MHIIIENEETVENYSSLKKCSEKHPEFSYTYLQKKSSHFPFEYKGWKFYKVRFNDRHYFTKKGMRE